MSEPGAATPVEEREATGEPDSKMQTRQTELLSGLTDRLDKLTESISPHAKSAASPTRRVSTVT